MQNDFIINFPLSEEDCGKFFKNTRSDVKRLGKRVHQYSRRDSCNNLPIDPMSFVYEDQIDQLVAYSFSKYWVGRVI